ncbi:Hypothetical protein NTJ_16180 [Nesidiocoris tenuis]|uniref:Uncharacterized protein n=1 Tax=Nesidiocoris tenuis TaxID=355587 RepID=A0ABN7BG92_9HEMI|nr:Hypothetical protein NTJ_16180 [Nesidiocoris tenuis]
MRIASGSANQFDRRPWRFLAAMGAPAPLPPLAPVSPEVKAYLTMEEALLFNGTKAAPAINGPRISSCAELPTFRFQEAKTVDTISYRRYACNLFFRKREIPPRILYF